MRGGMKNDWEFMAKVWQRKEEETKTRERATNYGDDADKHESLFSRGPDCKHFRYLTVWLLLASSHVTFRLRGHTILTTLLYSLSLEPDCSLGSQVIWTKTRFLLLSLPIPLYFSLFPAHMSHVQLHHIPYNIILSLKSRVAIFSSTSQGSLQRIIYSQYEHTLCQGGWGWIARRVGRDWGGRQVKRRQRPVWGGPRRWIFNRWLFIVVFSLLFFLHILFNFPFSPSPFLRHKSALPAHAKKET